MKAKTTKYVINVEFMGTVEVEVPSNIPAERRRALASKVALARILATTDNPEAPEAEACDEYEEEFSLREETAGRDWDRCNIVGTGGVWKEV